jgi:hypothetical protein
LSRTEGLVYEAFSVISRVASLLEFFRRRRQTGLLIVIVAAFMVRPLIGALGGAPLVFSLIVLVLMFVALHAITVEDLAGDRDLLLAERRRRRAVGTALGLLGIVARLALILRATDELVMLAGVTWLLFFVFVTWAELHALLRHREITGETISLAVAVYLLLGMCWGILYSVLFLLQPDAFSFGGSPEMAAMLSHHPEEAFPIFIYFSMTTLATIGFGDITPLTLQARYAAVAEGITGQFYLTILVARLVGVQISTSGRPVDR